jgi:putative exporter of polyketide antibiotics
VTSLSGLGALVRFTIRRDRGRLAAWVVVLTAVIGISAWNLRNVYATQQSIDA